MPEQPEHLRLAVAQSAPCPDPGDAAAVRASGQAIRRLMRAAHADGARVVLFPEGATCAPDKHLVAEHGWALADWPVLHRELTAIAALAGELRLCTVLGSVHRLTEPHRPHNSLYVLSEHGTVVDRYDERMLSHTKVSGLYTPGTEPVTFTVDGVRFGCLLGMEVHFPELFTAYERLDVDCVLFATTGGSNDAAFATEARGHAAAHGYWVGFAIAAGQGATGGIIGPDGEWLARCPDVAPSLVVADLDDSAPALALATGRARPWRRAARDGRYAAHVVTDDPRSNDRAAF